MSAAPVLAVDIGGTKIAAGLVDADGHVLAREQVPTGDDPTGTLAQVIDALTSAGPTGPTAPTGPTVPTGPTGIGIGCGGPMEEWPRGVVAPLNIPAWSAGFGLREWFVERFPGVPVRLHNDALAFVAGEHWRGAGQGHDDVLGVVVSTGVGGGLVLGGQLRGGPTGNAGHVGHVVVDPDGPPCGCGGHGCVEAIARGPAMVAWAQEQGLDAVDGPAVAEAARAGNVIALDAFRRSGRAVGPGLAGVAAALDLDVIVLGGGLTQAGDLLLEHVREAFAEYGRMAFVQRTRIESSALGADAGIVGAAALVLGGDSYWPGGWPS